MNQLRLIIDRQKRPNGYNCAIDTELDELPVATIKALHRHVQGYRGGLTYDRADFIMRNLLWLLGGYDVKAIVTDHTQRETQVYPF
ncbi:hypothetical protein ACWJ7D_000127 [Cronobacter sakazakii]|uniref:hypothetical protein n=1 Tax=Enterobacteriaceae TaxID=543 RepID=UPI000535D998|nr:MULTISPECIES: hypothetical protein [Enterobacteriaceae]AIX72566.1 hypothetical protein PSNIH2_01455 [Pantoea sp. PSNIH2]ELO3999088.1 hypothetical protein [Citrobacter freundii]MDK1221672.1 hypothetical protein [Cronobacter turicensis]POU52218.1 hypothetical protein C3380_01245 [Pantoea sp. PSNIH5]POU69715.1 hypothetical protein C3374_04480 [Pantoea sp. PSNIH4]POY69808.1 hypothetical protein C3402_01250 [Pantoea sp. PSNIH3]